MFQLLKKNERDFNEKTKVPNMKIMIFDTETTGLLNKSIPLIRDNLTKFPHIVQLSYIILDSETYQTLHIYDNIVKVSPGVKIGIDSSNIHGITPDISTINGTKIHHVICNFLSDIDKVDMVVCHNLEFDLTLIKVELMRMINSNKTSMSVRQMLTDELSDIINLKHAFCTMKESIDLCRIERENTRGKYFKYPTLSELHTKLFGQVPKNLHNSLHDVFITARCFVKMKYRIDLLDNNVDFKKQVNSLLH